MFGRNPCLCTPFRLTELLWVNIIRWINLSLVRGIWCASSYLIVSITLALTGNRKCSGYPLSILFSCWYWTLWVVQLLLFFHALFFNIGVSLILIVRMLLLMGVFACGIFHDFVNVGGKFYILKRRVVTWRFLKVIEVIILQLYHLILVELEGHVILSCSNWRIYALIWYHRIVLRNVLLLNMAISRTEWIKYWIVFNFPNIFQHYFLELTVKHVINLTASLLIRFHFAYWVAVWILARFVLLWTDRQAICKIRLVWVILNSANHWHRWLFDCAVFLTKKIDRHKLLVQLVVAQLFIKDLRCTFRND